MNYTKEIIISQPREKVIELFDNTENMKHWQKELLSYEFIEGPPGQNNSKMKLSYEMGKRKVEMIETINCNNLPDAFHCTYEAKGVFNISKNYFFILENNQTRWLQENTFRFTGIMKLMSFFMKSAFKKQTQKTLNSFKVFVENQP